MAYLNGSRIKGMKYKDRVEDTIISYSNSKLQTSNFKL